MRILRRAGLAGLLGGLLVLPGAARPQEKGSPAIDLKVVKYDALAALILENRGKVVIVDFWADTCIPCKRALPHLVQTYHKHRKDGLVAITVSVDIAWNQYDAKTHARLLNFLRKQGADFPNVVLDVSKEVLEDKLRVKAVPCTYVFDRQGKWTQFVGEGLNQSDDGSYPEIDALVKKLLKGK
jgi:thiol-disulfide isomerase/thioredoxin